MNTDLTFIQPLVASILRDEDRDWTVQGFGFLRTYFGPPDAPKRFRLNLWDSCFTVPGVSTIHDHPWGFTSLIVAGAFVNQRYVIDCNGQTHHFGTVKTGEGGGLEPGTTHEVGLIPQRPELYGPGDTYHQEAGEIHETIFANGTVTLNERIGDTQHASVFWPSGTNWVDAVPHRARCDEVRAAVIASLEMWFK